ncbi:MAG TPA: transcription antitermination factor NusB [Candidatus Paceibacterota bacterium]
MANRHLSRSIVLQTLFEWDVRKVPDDALAPVVERNLAEFAPGLGDSDFVNSLLKTVLSKRKDLDTIIEKAAPDWPLDKISTVDRNVLRMGLAELLFSDRSEVPAKVAINEAIELAKTYGGENSGKFVNGVLGSVYKELGEPGKDEESKRKKDKVTLQRLGGAIVYARHESEVYVALVHDVFGHWTLSKGGLEEKEDVEKGTLRELTQELGLKHLKVVEKLGENQYLASHPEKGKLLKHVDYFLVESRFEDIKLEQKGGLDDARWFKLADIVDLNFYDDILPIITKAVNMLLGKEKPKKSKDVVTK